VPLQHEGELFCAEGPVFVDEADPAVQLRVAGEGLLDAGHADQDHAEVAAVVVVAELLEGGWLEPVCFVDDEQFDEAGAAMGVIGAVALIKGIGGPDHREAAAEVAQFLVDHPGACADGRCVDDVCQWLRSLPPVKCFWDWRSIGSSSCQQA
jgi:hypothetical protein